MIDDPIEYLPVTNPCPGSHAPNEPAIKFVEHNGRSVSVPTCERCYPWRWKDGETETDPLPG